MIISDPPELKHAPVYRYNRFFRPMFEKACKAEMETFAMMREPISWLRSWYKYRQRPFLDGKQNSTANISFDDLAIESFFHAQSDLGKKSLPRYIRITNAMPTTASNKVVKRDLRAQGWECSDPVWLRDNDNTFTLLGDERCQQIRQQFSVRDREELIDFKKA